jgi:hypothetical protein
MEMAKEYRLNRMRENNDDEDDNNEANAATPPALVPPVEMVPEQEAPMAHEVILADAEPKLLQPHLLNMIMRDYEESPPRLENGPHELDDLDDLDDSTEADYDVDEWFPEDGSND